MKIETERLLLHPFLESDSEGVYEYLHEPIVNCFAIVLKETNKVIGEIDAYPESGESNQDKNAIKDTFSTCWMLNNKYQGKGYGYEAAKPSLIICLQKRVQDESMRILKTTIFLASIYVKN